jgi:hypothetical protein
MNQGEAYYMQSATQEASLIKFMVRTKETFDSSKTPIFDDPEPFVPQLADVSRDTIKEVGVILGKILESELEELDHQEGQDFDETDS